MAKQAPDPDPLEEEEIGDVRVARGLGWVFILLFLALIIVPPTIRNATTWSGEEWTPLKALFEWPSADAENLLQRKKDIDPRIARSEPSFIDHREAWEDRLDGAGYVRAVRRQLQLQMTWYLREGNRKTVIGEDGWFYFRPALDSLTGYGPLNPEPKSVTRDPNRAPWSPPAPAIIDFAEQLNAAGVELLLVPIPIKPMIVPDHLGVESPEGPISHPGAVAFYAELEEAGVQILDLKEAFFDLRETDPVFLKRDTHWTPTAMQLAATEIAETVKSRPWFGELDHDPLIHALRTDTVFADGDLLGNLELPQPDVIYPQQSVSVQQVIGSSNQPADIMDLSSPVVLLGDSFTNIYKDAAMGWGENAGLAQHLVHRLEMGIDTIARNGQASTGVRAEFAGRTGAMEMLKQKRIVIWAIAARDLFLSESTARETNVEWQMVTFNPEGIWAHASTPDPILNSPEMNPDQLVLKGELIARAPLPDPSQVNYPDSLLELKFRVTQVVTGEFLKEEILVVTWGFEDKELQEAASWRLGEEKTLTLVPFREKTDLQGLARAGLDEFLLEPWWAE